MATSYAVIPNAVPGMWSGDQLPCTGTTGSNDGL